MEWSEKYRPVSLSQIVGNTEAIQKLRRWNWKDKKALILSGPPGTGKTSSAYAFANEKNLEVVELNASDVRTKERILSVAGSASLQRTLSGKGRLIILDEADNIHGRADKGGYLAIINVIKRSIHPIILTANDYYALPLTLRRICSHIKFSYIPDSAIYECLEEISRKEKVKCSRTLLRNIVERCGGDLRSAINDLEALSLGRKKIEKIEVDLRDTRNSIFEVLNKILRLHDFQDALLSLRNLDESPEDFIHWLDENLPREYMKKDLTTGYKFLSRADIFLGRARRYQIWNLWKYATELMAGIHTAREGRYLGASYRRPVSWYRMLQAKSRKNAKSKLLQKIAERYKISATDAGFFLPLFRIIAEKDPEIFKELELDQEEIAFLLGEEVESEKVQKVLHGETEI